MESWKMQRTVTKIAQSCKNLMQYGWTMYRSSSTLSSSSSSSLSSSLHSSSKELERQRLRQHQMQPAAAGRRNKWLPSLRSGYFILNMSHYRVNENFRFGETKLKKSVDGSKATSVIVPLTRVRWSPSMCSRRQSSTEWGIRFLDILRTTSNQNIVVTNVSFRL